MRIDKFLVETNVATRSEAKKMLKNKSITVNKKIVTSAKTQINELEDTVMVDNQLIYYQKFHYFMLYKPHGVITATHDDKHKTVMDCLNDKDKFKNLSPIGRLDIDTTGLLLITDDGELNHNLLAPNKHVAKTYEADVAGKITPLHINLFNDGITLKDETKLKPAKLQVMEYNNENNTTRIQVTIHEGKYHQIKRMFASIDSKVLTLKRLSMGTLSLDKNLKPGQYRILTDSEISKLKGAYHG